MHKALCAIKSKLDLHWCCSDKESSVLYDRNLMIPNFQFSLSSALPVITRADLWSALEEDSISLVFSRLPAGNEDFSGAHEDES